ncbi:MAG: heavy-metal-associated domain-containing protein [Bacteriovoracaceae bacterium]|nr:heavy-metal-associated domain-containing protein [Bacteriovoracaceae bacterium]
MYKLKVENMKCKSCVLNIEDVLKELDPNMKVTVDLASKLVVIDSVVDLDKIIQVLAEEGHSALTFP